MVRDLSLAEIAELTEEQAAGIELPSDADTNVREYTAAEVALLEEEGFEAEVDFESATLEAAAGEVTKALTLSRGNKHFKAVVVDSSANADRVNLYDTLTGHPYPVPRTLLRYYLDKLRPDGSRVFSARRTVQPPARTIPCGAEFCKEGGARAMFTSHDAMEDHWQAKHATDWARRQRRIDRDDTSRQTVILEMLARSLAEGRREMTTEEIANINAIAEKNAAELAPNESWSKTRIIAWMEAKQMPYGIQHTRMTKRELLVDIGALEPEEELVTV